MTGHPELESKNLPTSVLATTRPESERRPTIRASIAAMNVLTLSSSGHRDDAYYREQWLFYYAERRRLLTRLFWLAGALAVCFLLFLSQVDVHRLVGLMIAAPMVLLLLALLAQWFIFVWTMRTWTCPRCGDSFFTSTFVNNPFGRRCRHCGLVRPRQSEIKEAGNRGEHVSKPR